MQQHNQPVVLWRANTGKRRSWFTHTTCHESIPGHRIPPMSGSVVEE